MLAANETLSNRRAPHLACPALAPGTRRRVERIDQRQDLRKPSFGMLWYSRKDSHWRSQWHTVKVAYAQIFTR
jgi:hypothetical protein